MSLIGWSRWFEQYAAIQDIPDRVKKTEILYWCSLLGGVAVLVGGVAMMRQSPESQFGLLLAISGVVSIALVKIWAHIRLATYQVILEMRERK